MRIKYIEARPLGNDVEIKAYVSGDRDSILSQVQKAKDGLRYKPNGDIERPYDLVLKAFYESKTDRQLKAIWGKIGEIASAIGSTKDEVYEECLRRYAPSFLLRTDETGLNQVRHTFRLVDIKEARSDKTYFIQAYLGLSQYDSKQAKEFLDGVLDECREVGIDADI